MTCSIGTLEAFCIEGDLFPAVARTTKFKQFGRDGNGFIIGALEQASSKLESTHFTSGDRAGADDVKFDAADIVGTVVTITRDVGGVPVTVENCFVESCTLTESKACVGIPGCDFKTKLSWEICTPVDWS